MTDEIIPPVPSLEFEQSENPTILPNTTSEQVEFSEAQQRILENAIKQASARAGKSAREETARLKLENERLQALAVGNSPDASEVEKLRAQLADEKLRAAAADARATQQEKQVFQNQLATQIDAVDAASVSKLLADSLAKRGGKWVVIDEETGVDKLNADGSAQTPAQAYAEWALKHPWAIRGRVVAGTGSTGSTGSVPPPQVPLEHYFGSKSNAAAVNKLSIQRPEEYRRLRREAIKKGLI